MDVATLPQDRVWDLPPIILHPFSDPTGPDQLVESSRAHLMMQGLLPLGKFSKDDVERRFLTGRYTEIRMLFFVGRDLARWLEQCEEFASRDELLSAAGVNAGSFVRLLIDHTPTAVKEKLTRWGVADYRAIFMRALGLNSVFSEAPERDSLTPHFIKFYYRYADQMFLSRQASEASPRLSPANFTYDLFASGEYSRMLEKAWEQAG